MSLLEKAKPVLEFIPAVSICVVVVGYFNLYFYYNQFGIDISTFIDASEIIFSFSAIFFDIVLVIIVYGVTFYDAVLDKNPNNTNRNWILAGVVITVAYVYFSRDESVFTGTQLLFYFTIGYIVIILLMQLIIQLLSKVFKKEPRTDATIAGMTFKTYFIIIGFFLFLMVRNQTIADNLKDGIEKYEVEIVTDTYNYYSSPVFIYIGSTNKYYFFYNRYTKKVTAVKPDNLKSVKITKLHNNL